MLHAPSRSPPVAVRARTAVRACWDCMVGILSRSRPAARAGAALCTPSRPHARPPVGTWNETRRTGRAARDGASTRCGRACLRRVDADDGPAPASPVMRWLCHSLQRLRQLGDPVVRTGPPVGGGVRRGGSSPTGNKTLRRATRLRVRSRRSFASARQQRRGCLYQNLHQNLRCGSGTLGRGSRHTRSDSTCHAVCVVPLGVARTSCCANGPAYLAISYTCAHASERTWYDRTADPHRKTGRGRSIARLAHLRAAHC